MTANKPHPPIINNVSSSVPRPETSVNVKTPIHEQEDVVFATSQFGEDKQQPKLTRRTWMNMIMGAAAFSTAASVPVRTVAARRADDELLVLGEKLDAIYLRLAVTLAVHEPFWEEHKRRLEEWKIANPHPAPGAGMAAYERIWNELKPAGECPDDVTDEIDPIARAIMKIPATTLAGLAVKARLAKGEASHFWRESYRDCDWDHLCMRSAIDELLAFAARQAA